MFTEATGVASIITDPEGVPITNPSNFCRLCIDIIRKTETGRKNCYKSDKEIGRQNIDGAIYQPCLSGGLWDAGVSISIGETHVANWLVGQVKNEEVDEDRLHLYAIEIGADPDEFKAALDEVPVMSVEKFKSIAKILFYFANEISRRAYQNLLQKNLIAELKSKEIQLLKAKEKAEESDRLKTAFLQNMSHEIRTPMNAIMGFSSLLADSYYNRLNLEKYASIIYQRSNDLLDLMNDILDLSKIESGQLSLNIEKCILPDLFMELDVLFSEYKKRISREHVDLLFQIKGINETEILKIDKGKLKQILINLIGNALKFTDEGYIKCGVQKEGDKLLFKVTDTGVGIPEDKHEIVFQRFAQLEQTGPKNRGGTGLGLAIARGLCELLGGKIWLESEVGKGTTFYFTVAYEVGAASGFYSTRLAGDNFIAKISGKTVLIVEDDFYNAEYLKEILESRGFKILLSEFGEEAIEIARNNHIDLILMDIRLPDISGYEAARIIRANDPQVKVIAQTAFAGDDEWQRAIDSGCSDYISKPTNRQLLIEMIGKHLSDNQQEALL